MIDNIDQAFQEADSQLSSTKRNFKERLPSRVYRDLEAKVQSEVQDALHDAVKVTEERAKKIREIEEAAADDSQEDLGLFERATIRLNALHPGGIIQDIQQASQFGDLVERYAEFAKRLQKGPTVSQVAARYILPGKLVRHLLSRCSAVFLSVKQPLQRHASITEEHVEKLNELSESKFGKGLAMFSNLASNAALGAATSALTGNAFVGLSARKKASSKISGWVAEKYFGPTIRREKEKPLESFDALKQKYESALEECWTRTELVVMTMYGGLLNRVENDLNDAGQSIEKVEWSQGLITPRMLKSSREEFITWAEETLSELEKLAADRKWVQLADTAHVALEYTIDKPVRSSMIEAESGLSYAVLFAQRRAQGIMEIADSAWENDEFVRAAQLYAELLGGSPVAFDHDHYECGRAGWRLALAGTLADAPQELRKSATSLLPFIRQVVARRDVKEGQYEQQGETISRGSIRTAAILHQFTLETETEPNLNRRVMKQLRTDDRPIWRSESVPDFRDIETYLEIPTAKLDESDLVNWVVSKRQAAKRHQYEMVGAIAFAVGLVCVLLYMSV